MTYCLGIMTRYGLVMASDSRTNAGVDYISTYRKLFDFSQPGDRVIIICVSGNLSITQNVLTGLYKDIKTQADISLYTLPSLYEVSHYIGHKIRQNLDHDSEWLKRDGIDYNCNFLLGGQILGEDPEMYLIYSQGNCIHATPETPFLQIGETKYGKPILDRTLSFNTPLEAAAKCALLSIDSTMKSNISVGPPINLVMYYANSFKLKHRLELRLGDPYLAEMRRLWEGALKKAFEQMPELNWEYYEDSATPKQDVLID